MITENALAISPNDAVGGSLEKSSGRSQTMPLPQIAAVFPDVDRTLVRINTNEVTNPLFPQRAQALRERGWLVCLNSGRSLFGPFGLERFAEQTGLPDVVFEGGAGIYQAGHVLMCHPGADELFPSARQEIHETIAKKNGIQTHEMAFARSPLPDFEGAIVFVSDPTRKGSACHHIGRVEGGKLTAYEDLSQVVLPDVAAYYQDIPGTSVDCNMEMGRVIVTTCSKRTGAELYLAKHDVVPSPAHRYVSIGDSPEDNYGANSITCAVNNATSELIRGADYVTKGTYADGVVEVFDHLLRQSAHTLVPRQIKYE